MPAPQTDRFDTVADVPRVGAHRAPLPRGRGWVAFAWAALATGVLVGAGVLGLGTIERHVLDVPSSKPAAAAPKITPTVDPRVDVVLLNATTTGGLAADASDIAKKAGWTVESVANADSTDVAMTTVYYNEKGQAGAAAGLAKSLGVTHTAITNQFAVAGQSRLTVVLGKDFASAHG